MERLLKYIDVKQGLIEKALVDALPKADIPPAVLHEAMRYSVIGGGKRLRPLLVIMGAEMFGSNFDEAMSAACALEMVHCYSLIHDDLPSMDNDDMRRGRLTCHKAYDEATAILAGDALLTLAFEMLAEAYPPRKAVSCVLALSRAAGHVGMVGGQMMDIEAEGKDIPPEEVEGIHRRKTGALIAAACRIGGIIGGGEGKGLEQFNEYGKAIGLLFQITDDILDVTATDADMGKQTGKDSSLGKATFISAYGMEKSTQMARQTAVEAKNILKEFGAEALMPRLLADYILERKN